MSVGCDGQPQGLSLLGLRWDKHGHEALQTVSPRVGGTAWA
jgi:hypothetical protein